MLSLKKLLSSISPILALLLFIFPARGEMQTVPPAHATSNRPSAPGQVFTEADLKAFINTIFLTAQEVRPELRAAALRQLASVIVPVDAGRALWVYDQAFQAAEQISAPNKPALREAVEREIILEEAKHDLPQAIDHALSLQSEPPTPDGSRPGGNMKLALLAELARKIPEDDVDSLFQKTAPVLVREDTDFGQTLTLAGFFQKSHPERAQQLFSQAVAKFNNIPAEEPSLRSFAALTTTVGATNPNLAELGIEVLLKKADEIDSKTVREAPGDPQAVGSTEGVYGPAHLLILSQFLPLMRKINPARGDDWAKALQDGRNQNNLKIASTRRVPQSNVSTGPRAPITPGSSTSPRMGQLGPSVPGAGSSAPTPYARSGGSNAPNEDPDQPVTLEQWMRVGRQPPSAFSLTLTRDLVKAQTLSKNQPAEYSRRLEEILPRLQLESNPQAKAAALAQIALAYFQMGDTTEARKYLSESLIQSQQGDSPLLRNSTSPSLFFSMYSATSNVVTKLVPQFPEEAIEATKSISDSQLRLRVMVDAIRFLGPHMSTSMRHP